MKELHPSQVYASVVDFLVIKGSVIGIASITFLLLVLSTTAKPANKVPLAAGACAAAMLGSFAKRYERTKKQYIGDISEASQHGFKQVVASLVQIGSTVSINQSLDGWEPDGLMTINDLASMLCRRHGRIIGGTGDGKSVLAKALVRLIDGKCKIFDVEATKKDWQGFEIVGRGENWDAVGKAMLDDMKIFANRVGEATSDDNDAGWDIFKGQTLIRVVEEYPDCKDEVNSRFEPITEKGDYKGLADEWCQRLARRGRKPGILLLLVSQYDNVTAWGFEGKGSLVNCFHAIRLGQFAVDHAKKVGDNRLVKWIESDKERRCMVDDKPCQLLDRTSMIMLGSNSPAVATSPTSTSDTPSPSTQLNDLEAYIVDWGKRNPGQTLKARNLQQASRLFQGMPPEDIRIIFSAMADKGIGSIEGEKEKMGWKAPASSTSCLQ